MSLNQERAFLLEEDLPIKVDSSADMPLLKTDIFTSYLIYAPDRFVLGRFIRQAEGLKLVDNINIFYFDDSATLEEYNARIENGRIKTVRDISFPVSALEELARQGRAYNEARAKISQEAEFYLNIKPIRILS